jgi:large subunit ribosomal protein L21
MIMTQKAQFGKYAIFQTGGKQYQAIEGQTVAIEKLEGEAGASLEFKEVLFRKNELGEFEIGQPYLEMPIRASIVKQMSGPKLIAFRFKRRHKVRVKKGHRQPITVIRIEQI